MKIFNLADKIAGLCSELIPNTSPIRNLQEEGGITQVSLENAKTLMKRYPRIIKIVLYIDKNEHLVDVVFADMFESYTHAFSGFSWGYIGEGPRGLKTFLKMANIDVSREEIASWSQSVFYKEFDLLAAY